MAEVLQNFLPKYTISQTEKDFEILQKIIDSKSIPCDDIWASEALGIIFGDALLASIDGLQWREVTDEYGTPPCLWVRGTRTQINAPAMISTRIEDGDEVRFDWLVAWVNNIVKQTLNEKL
ncbi:MAG: DUF3806 domain-containing protein [Hyphomicrobiales bacterium]|nr:DUF3806 domain-containing protein [Hyphomicrobiales bacterium]